MLVQHSSQKDRLGKSVYIYIYIYTYTSKCPGLGCIEGDDTIRKSNIDMGYDIDAPVRDEASTG